MNCYPYYQTLAWWNNGWNVFTFRVKGQEGITPGESIEFVDSNGLISDVQIKPTRRTLSFASGKLTPNDRDFVSSIKFSPAVLLFVEGLANPVQMKINRDSFLIKDEIETFSQIEFSLTFAEIASTL